MSLLARIEARRAAERTDAAPVPAPSTLGKGAPAAHTRTREELRREWDALRSPVSVELEKELSDAARPTDDAPHARTPGAMARWRRHSLGLEPGQAPLSPYVAVKENEL